METQRKGMRAENIAKHWLENEGLVLLERNFLRKTGEIDLIMLDKKTIVFVEVRYRGRPDFGGPIASITQVKQHRIVKTAQLYLQQKGWSNRAARIDVIAISGSLQTPQCRWIRNAIEASSSG